MTQVISFDEAIRQSAGCKKRHLLLGNGFSIACKPDIFIYQSLQAQADYKDLPEVARIFNALETHDFEVVIKALQDASLVLPFYDPAADGLARKISSHADTLKQLLVKTIAGNHPNIPNEIDDEKYWACRKFLAYFLASNNAGNVYTLNYDLLLYWTVLHDDMPFTEPIDLKKNDGFGRDDYEAIEDFVTWQGESSAHGQNIHYLHGALHLFDAGVDLHKYTWSQTGIRLMDQAREALDNGLFPLFVAEGTSDQKLTKIKHSGYLYHSYKSFSGVMRTKDACLFIYGHSLADNDRHVLEKIAKGKVETIYVSVHGDIGSESNRKLVANAEALKRLRTRGTPLNVIYYDAASANVWGAS
jgi:hypothetical protein